MYLNQAEKGYLVTYDNGNFIWNGGEFVSAKDIGEDFVIYTAERAHRELRTMCAGHPYDLKECATDVVVVKLDNNDHRWWTPTKDKRHWCEVEVDLGFGAGYFIDGMGTTPQVIKLNINKDYYIDIHVQGKKIVRVVQHLCGETWESNNFMMPIDNGAARFFRMTDRVFNFEEEDA